MNILAYSFFKRPLSLCLLILLPVMSLAATDAGINPNIPHQWQLDVPTTDINFQVNYLRNATVNGHFDQVDGSIRYDANNPTATTIDIIVATDSIDTGMKLRDTFLRKKPLLNADQYPTITFVSKNIDMITPTEANVTGDFTVLGQTKPLTVNVTLSEVKSDPVTNEPVLNFKATGKLNRYDYGVTAFPSLIGNLIAIEITGQLIADD